MKTVLFFKQFDFVAQILAFLIPVVSAVVVSRYYLIIFCYLAGGAVQVISCIANGLALNKFYRNKGRVVYEYLLFGMALITFITLLFRGGHLIPDLLLGAFYAIMVISPFMAIWYMWLSYREVSFLKSLVNRKQYV